MPGVVRQGDSCTGHSCYPSRPSASWSPDVFADGLPVVRQNDIMQAHGCPDCIPHGGTHVGVHTVFANGACVQTCGDAISCGSSCAECSPDVFVD